MLDRLFGGNFDFGGGMWIVILFFLFLVFSDCWSDIDISAWIPFLILLLIVCASNDLFDGCGC